MTKFCYCSMCGVGFQVTDNLELPIWHAGESFLCRHCAMDKRKLHLHKVQGANVR